MAAATERIPVLVSAPEKARISKAAKAAGLSMGEFLRRAASHFRPDDDEQAMDGLLDQVRKTTASASRAMDKALIDIAASNKRIDAMERAARKRQGGT